MSQPLPGFVDTGITKSVTETGTLAIKVGRQVASSPTPLSQDNARMNDWTVYCLTTGGSCILPPPPTPHFGVSGEYQLWVSNPFIGPDVEVYHAVFPCHDIPPPTSTQTGSLTDSQGPYRLGVAIEIIDPSPHYPQFWTNFRIVYQWFLDENTIRNSTFFGISIGPLYPKDPPSAPGWQTTPPVGMTPRGGSEIGALSIGANIVLSIAPGVDGGLDAIKFSALTSDGWVWDTSDFPVGALAPNGSGAIHSVATGSGGGSASSPYHFNYDIDITKFGMGTTNAHVLDTFECVVQSGAPGGGNKNPQSPSLTCPVTNSYVVPVTSWPTHNKVMVADLTFDIDGGWAAAQDPPMKVDDLRVPLWPNPALTAPSSGGATYQPAKMNKFSSQSVEFPDGTRRSHWTINNGAYGSVTENAGSTVFHVTDTRAVFSRTFVQSWRTWTSSPFPRGVDGYEWTKHDSSADDVWDFSPWGWMQIPLSGPSAATATLKIDGVDLEVSDSHTTGSDRATSYSQTEHAFSYNYDLPITNGASSPFIDLLFPVSGGTNPIYPTRVDKLIISGLPVGDTTVTDIKLVTRSNGYMKVDYGPPVVREDYSCLHGIQDGAFQWGAWPDELYKPDEIGIHPPYGGAARYVDILTGSVSGDIEDAQYNLSTFLAHLNRMEGWTFTYDSAAFDAANRDSFGNAIGPELACWLRPNAPFETYIPGTDYKPKCGPVVRSYRICNAFSSFDIYTREPVWGALEALVKDGTSRAAAGITVQAYRTDTGGTVATDTTDSMGVAQPRPIPANASRVYGLRTP